MVPSIRPPHFLFDPSDRIVNGRNSIRDFDIYEYYISAPLYSSKNKNLFYVLMFMDQKSQIIVENYVKIELNNDKKNR